MRPVALKPIDQYMARDGSAQTNSTEALRELSWDGNTYGLPLTVDARSLFYNKLLQEAGASLPPPGKS